MSVPPSLRRLVALSASLLLAVAVLAVLPGARLAAAGPRDLVGRIFEPLPEHRIPPGPRVRVRPSEFSAFTVSLRGLRTALAAAPGPREARRGAERLVLSVPDPDGRPVRFALEETALMEPGLAEAHPELRTYAGQGVDDPTLSIALDVTPMGLHASVRRPGGGDSWLIDPQVDARGTATHLSYHGRDAEEPVEAFDFQPPLPRLGVDPAERAGGAARAARTAPGSLVPLRTYRLALVTDPSYAAYFGSDNVLAEKLTLITRVNQVYNDDLAIRMVLVEGTERLNLDTPTKATGSGGPCGASGCYTPAQLAGCSGALLTRNTFVLGQLVGADAYDIGHIALGLDGGGIAGLGVVGESRKAAGCTGLAKPQGDSFAVDYVAHEMGHQFNGNHTFDGTQRNCALANRNAGTAVEPGSGSSVMAYAGICGHDDLQPHTDPYFSQRSLDEVDEHVTAAPVAYDEQQTISLRRWDTAQDAVRLTYPGRAPVTIANTPLAYNTVAIQQKVEELTGLRPTVEGYDGATLPGAGGFALYFEAPTLGAGVDVARIGVEPVDGDATGFTGVQVQGGPGGNRGLATPTGNHAPTVVAPGDRTIPTRTPFTLAGSGSDSDGDPLVFLWEQNDEGADPTSGTALTDNDKTDGPLFRVFGTAARVDPAAALQSPSPGQNVAVGSPHRTFPDMAQVLGGNTNAATGTCPTAPADPKVAVPPAVLECFSEFLPTSAYGGDPATPGSQLSFRLTARDQRAGGGGTAFDDVVLRVATGAGPFLLTSQGTAGRVRAPGTVETVTWAVNGTDAPTLARDVRITLSEDGGQTFGRVLAASTPNDGSATITWPDVASDRVRLRIEAVGNYFFDVNDADLTVADTVAPRTTVTGGPATGALLAATSVRFRYTADEPATYACRLDARVVGCPPGGASLGGLGAGVHRFAVAARDAAGNLDETPAVRRFAVAHDDRQLRRSRGWRARTGSAHFRGTYLVTRRRGAQVALDVVRARRVGLVVATGRGHGRVVVRIGSRVVGRVRLGGPARTRALRVLPELSAPLSGRLTVRTTSRRQVRLDGIAVYTD